jgi:uncharacterized protein (DUF1499 family)
MSEGPRRGSADRGAGALLLGGTALLQLLGCGAPAPETLGPTADGLRPCPRAPNCVHTGEGHPAGVRPFLLADAWLERSDDELWGAIEGAVASLRGSAIVDRTPEYLHAEVTSRIFRFVDDLEVYRAPGARELIVRSESRVGRNDMGVNIRRVEALREALLVHGVVR